MKNIKQLVLVLIAILFIGVMIGVFLNRLSNKNISLTDHGSDIENVQEDSYRDSMGKININHASVDELAMLPGIGKKTAERIVAYRQKFGPFFSIDDLTKVNGIGDKTLEKLKDYITVGG